MTLVLSLGMNILFLLWGLSDPRIAELREMPRIFSIKVHSGNQISGHLGMSGGRSPRHAQNPLSGKQRKTLSITHHALSPPPSHHHLYIIDHLTTTFLSYYNVKDHLCRKVTQSNDLLLPLHDTVQRVGGRGGGTNISERRTPLSHLLGCCEPPRRVTLHMGVVLGWGTR